MDKGIKLLIGTICLLAFFLPQSKAQTIYSSDEVIFRLEEGFDSSQQQKFIDTYHLVDIEGPTPVTGFYKARVDCFSCLPSEIYRNAIDSINGVIRAVRTGGVNSGGLNYNFDLPPTIGESINNPGILENCPTDFSLTIPYGNCGTIKTGIFDTGLLPNSHQGLFLPYINSRNDFGVNFVASSLPFDDHGHGTAMASAIIGENTTVANPNVELRSYKIHTMQGTGDVFDAIYAIDTSIIEGVNIINMSFSYFGLYNDRFDSTNPMNIAISAAQANNILIIAAAGNRSNNNNDNPNNLAAYPSSFLQDNILSVAATNCDGNLAQFSSFGRFSVDLAALGKEVIVAGQNNEYALMAGTSPATALVAGVATSLATHLQNFDFRAIKNAILDGVTVNANLGNKVATSGFLNAENAIIYLKPSCGPTPAHPRLKINNFSTSNAIDLQIESVKPALASITIFNSIGQVFTSDKIQLSSGINNYRWTYLFPDFNGLYFISIQVGNTSKVIKILR